MESKQKQNTFNEVIKHVAYVRRNEVVRNGVKNAFFHRVFSRHTALLMRPIDAGDKGALKIIRFATICFINMPCVGCLKINVGLKKK